MKWKNRMIALLLAFVLLLAGCRNGQLSVTDDATVGTTADTTAGTTEYVPPTDETTESTEPEIIVTCQYLPETIENPSNLPVLKWVCMTSRSFGGGERTWNEEAAVELNQMLADRNMPYRVQFVLLTMNEQIVETQRWFDFPEAQEALKDADLIYGAMSTDRITHYLSPITEYVTGTAEPSLKNAVAHEVNWLRGTVDGEIYGYGTLLEVASSNGWSIDAQLLTAAGLKAEDLQKNFWEMDDIFAKLYQTNDNKPFLFLRNRSIGRRWSGIVDGKYSLYIGSIDNLLPKTYQQIGSYYAVDYSQQTPVVVNYLETEVIRRVTEAMTRYFDADYATSVSNKARMSYQNIYGDSIYTISDGNVYIPVTEAVFPATLPEGYVNGVAAVSQHKAEAVSLLNLIAEDEAFRMQLFYGKESRDYQIVDGYYEIVIQEDGSNYSLDFLSPLSYFSGFTSEKMKAEGLSPGTENWHFLAQDGKTLIQTYQDLLDNSIRFYPIVFDYTGLERELAAMEDILFEKYDILKNDPLTEDIRQQLVEDLKAAGSDKVLAELQRQLSEWQKNNPDWPLKPEE